MFAVEACVAGHVEVVQLLVARGCNTKLTNASSQTGWDRAKGAQQVRRALKEFAAAGHQALASEIEDKQRPNRLAHLVSWAHVMNEDGSIHRAPHT